MAQHPTAPAARPDGDEVLVAERTTYVVGPSLLARLGAEAFGTFVLVLAILGTALYLRVTAGGLSFPVALAGGLALFAAIAAVGHVSGGHFNPAVTLGAAIAGRTAWRDVLPYWVAQLAGAVVAGLVLVATLPQTLLAALQQGGALQEATREALFQTVANGFEEHAPIGGQMIEVPVWNALLVELVLVAVLVGVILAVTDRRSPVGNAPAAIGATLAVGLFVALPLTNAGLNPARSFAAAVFAGGWTWGQVWLFVVAPLLGAALAGLFYRAFAASVEEDDLLGEDVVVEEVEDVDTEADDAATPIGDAPTDPSRSEGATSGAVDDDGSGDGPRDSSPDGPDEDGTTRSTSPTA